MAEPMKRRSQGDYLSVEGLQQEVLAWSTPLFIPELTAYSALADLVLGVVSALPAYGRGKLGEQETVLTLLIGRMFNDYEACKRLILIGLPLQTYMPLRDAVECSGLITLFAVDQKKALKWLTNLNEYSAGSVNTALQEHGVNWQAYQHYGMLSHLTHPNLLATLEVVREVDLGNRSVIRHFHLGGWKNERWMRQEFHVLLVLMMLALHECLSAIAQEYHEDFGDWWDRLRATIPQLEALGIASEHPRNRSADPPKRGASYEDLVNRRLNLNVRVFDRDWISDPEPD